MTLTANPPGSCVLPQTVTFSASPSNPNYNLTSYQWQFSNGMTSNLANPSITFTNPGFYGATLVATSSQGCVDTVENAQLVSLSDGQVIPSFTLNPTQVCAGYPVQFLNTSLGGVDFTWLVNGGIYSNQFSLNPTFYYPDTLEVALVGSAPGCVGDTSDVQTLIILPSSAYYAAQRTCDGSNTVTFSGFDASASSLWLYPGDGSSVNVTGLNSYVHTYSPGATYNSYALSQNNQSGCQDTFNRALFIPNFNLDFTISPNSGCAPLPVTLTSATTGFSSIRWGFGNGQLSPLIGINASNPVSTVNYTYPTPGTYNVFLVGNYNFGGGHICRDTLFQTLEVFPVPQPQIQVLSHTGCGPVTMAFQASAPAGSTLLWDFGDGATSTEWQPVHTFINFGGNTVVLHATLNGCEGTDTLSGYEFYSQAPNAQVVVSPTQACPWTQVNLTGFITGNYSTAYWNFGDGTTGPGSSQTHTYSNTGQFLPSLNVLDTLGCLYTFTALDTVYVTQPVASFPPPFVQQACPPVVVSFSNNSQNAVSYLWDFGNGATSSQPSPTTTYTLPGSYQPQLIVWDLYGCTDTLQAATGSLVVAGPVLEELVISDPTPCPGQLVHFEIQSPNATVFILNVDTTGQYVVGSSVSFTYNSAGMYFPFVTLGTQVGNQFCLVNFPQDTLVVAPLDISVSSPPPACRGSLFPVSAANADFYQWAPPHLFSLGNSGAFASALPDSSGWVWVTGTDTNGCADTDSLWLEVYPKPDASFAYTNACVYSPLSFSNTSVSQTPVVQYQWNFGNQGLSALDNPVFVFTSPGLHPVSLVIQTTQGCLDTAEATVEIYPLPVAQFSTSGTCAGAPVQWENVSSVSSPYFLQNTTWILDGQILGASLPAAFYLSEGLHNLTLITESNTGCRDTLSQNIQIFPQPQASFSISNSLACSGEPVIFTDQSFFPENSGNLTWYIYDANGNANVLTTAPGGQTSFLPQSSGDHNVMLVATSVHGCTDTLSGQGFFFVSPPVMAAFELNPSQMSILQPQVTVVNQSIGYDNLLWTFGDGFTSTNESVQHSYQEPGEYKVTLVATNAYGCQDDTTALVTVLPEPLLYVPNAFSPGVLDGINDYFSVKGMGIQEFQITIFDRWGEKIFESNDLDFAWDGTYKGKVVPQGAYVYRIEAVDIYAKVYDLHGTITVIR
ncbi:MAG: PKD domain-containing protein [Flavobacteriales bacterium]|nr:PKD domain-containing protein [Flavobacteriales bacterium]